MSRLINLVIFTLDQQRYALHLSAVERIVRVVEVTPLPKAPEITLGVINVQGEVIPVLDIRKRFRLPERKINLNDQLIIARTSRRTAALLVDATTGVLEYPEEQVIAAEKVLPRMEYVEGVAKLEDGLIFIHNLDKFLSLEEDETLGDALVKTGKIKKE